MNTQQKPFPHSEPRNVKISLEGPPEEVQQMLQRLAGPAPDAPTKPEPLYISRPEASRRTGIGENRLSALVKLGKLTNYGSSGKLLFNLAEIRALGDRSED